jgi:hypothetical protein
MKTCPAIACLVTAALLTAACGEPRTADPATSVATVDVWREIPEAPVGFYHPEGAFWIDERLVVVAASTIQAWDPKRDQWTVAVEIPQAADCEGCGYSEVAVWTGERILLWGGGFSYRAPDGSAHEGASVDLQGEIAPLPNAPIRSRWWHTAVWTGREMIVWGGACGEHECRDGAAYDPETDSWRHIAKAPVPGYAHSVVWTGQEMIVWGGSDDHESEGMKGCVTSFVADGAAYDPVQDSWRELPVAPLEARGWHSAVWTGSEMVVWGGATGLGCDYGYPTDGAAYDPATNSWRPIASSPLSGRVEASAIWTGSEMIVWGGSTHGRSVTLDDGAAFDPSSNGWRTLSEAPIQSRALHVVTWTGKEMIIWGGCCNKTRGSVSAFADGAVLGSD